MERQGSVSALDELLPLATASEASDPFSNPRKRKKSSRACDFCHVNHQPCDNSKPRCGYCERHGKTCLYLRPQKKRGPAQGYRSALHTMRESAAAWGAALNLIPSLGPVIEGYLKNSAEGKRLVKAIKDPQQQEFFIQAWQQSPVFKAFFEEDEEGEDGDGTGGGTKDDANNAAEVALPAAPSRNKRARATSTIQAISTTPATSLSIAANGANGASGTGNEQSLPLPDFQASALLPHEAALLKLDPKFDTFLDQHAPTPSPSQDDCAPRPSFQETITDMGPPSVSLSDIVARDAARSSNSFSQTLGSLGFAPDETLTDFLALSYNPDPINNNMGDLDPSLGSEMDQKAYYELLMGKRFT